MIIYHQRNVAAFAGNHNYWFQFQPTLDKSMVSVTTAGPAINLLNFMRGFNRGAYVGVARGSI